MQILPLGKNLDLQYFSLRDLTYFVNTAFPYQVLIHFSWWPKGVESLFRPVFTGLGPRGARPQARPTAHPIGRRPLASLEQGERRPTGSRAAGLHRLCFSSDFRNSGYDSSIPTNFLGGEPHIRTSCGLPPLPGGNPHADGISWIVSMSPDLPVRL